MNNLYAILSGWAVILVTLAWVVVLPTIGLLWVAGWLQ